MFSKTTFIILFVSLLLASCGGYNRLLKDGDKESKYAAAITYYEKGDYFKALQLFDDLLLAYRGTVEAEKIYYYYAYCHYQQGQFIMAAYHFEHLSKTFPRSKHAEECTFMAAYCKYLESPDVTLDQTSTIEAIDELQLFVNKYPNSTRIEECNNLIDELRLKLEEKAYLTAMLYYQMEDYRSSILAMQNVVKDFPSTSHKEDLLFFILNASYQFANGSIASKQPDRYAKTIQAYKILEAAFPNGKYASEAAAIIAGTNQSLAKIQNH